MQDTKVSVTLRVKIPRRWKMRTMCTMQSMFWPQICIFKTGWESQWDLLFRAKGIICPFRTRLQARKVNNVLVLSMKLLWRSPKATGNDFFLKGIEETFFFSVPLDIILYWSQRCIRATGQVGKWTHSILQRGGQAKPEQRAAAKILVHPSDFLVSQLKWYNWFHCHRLGLLYSNYTHKNMIMYFNIICVSW